MQMAGPLPYAEFYVRVGDRNIYGIDWTFWLANRWRGGAAFALNFAIRPDTANGFQFICTVAGESGTEQPTWPAAIGATVNDGSITWTCEAIDNTSLATTLQSAIWTPPTGVTTSGPTIAGQIASAMLDATAAVVGNDYLINCAATMTDTEVKVGQIKLKVR